MLVLSVILSMKKLPGALSFAVMNEVMWFLFIKQNNNTSIKLSHDFSVSRRLTKGHEE